MKTLSGGAPRRNFYQPAVRKARGWLVLRLLCGFRICIIYIYIYMYVRLHLSRAQ